MTKVQIRLRLQRPLDDEMMSRLPAAHARYGIQKVTVNGDDTLTVEYDATRLRPAEVESTFLVAGIPVSA
jgi:hypothetical protein